MGTTAAPRTVDEVADRLARELARQLAVPVREVPHDAPLDGMGLDSAESVEVAVSLESWLGRPLPATLLQDHRTVAAAARFAAGDYAPQGRTRAEPAASSGGGPLAIVGIGRRFPGDGPLEDLDAIDAGYFDLAPEAAARLGTPERVLLEVVAEALEDAGIPSEDAAGGCGGVFVAGAGGSPAAARLSHAFDLHGPSVTLDDDRASSLVAVHLACGSLLDGECHVAVAGGLHPDEGAAVLVLKRLPVARSAGDSVYALIERGGVTSQGRDTEGGGEPGGAASLAKAALAMQDGGAEGEPAADVTGVGSAGTTVRVLVEAAPEGAR
jgi:phthiocerol/phenolphthiocerol synthesis type-I polyketide synthase D